MATPPAEPQDELCQFVSRSVGLHCSKCGLLANRPATISCCEEIFCSSCTAAIQEEDQPCPSCGETNFTLMIDSLTSVKVLGVPCVYRSRGCLWSDSLDQLPIHLDPDLANCQYMDVECPLGCKEDVQKNFLKFHMSEECLKRIHTCPFCSYQASYEEVINVHLHECKFVPMKSPNIYGEVLDQKLGHYLGDLQKSIDDLKERDQKRQMQTHVTSTLGHLVPVKNKEKTGKTKPKKRRSDMGPVSEEELTKGLQLLELEMDKLIKIDRRREKQVQTEATKKRENVEEVNIELPGKKAKGVSFNSSKSDREKMAEVEEDTKRFGECGEQREVVETFTDGKKTEGNREEQNEGEIRHHQEVTLNTGEGGSTRQAGMVDMMIRKEVATETEEAMKNQEKKLGDSESQSIDWDFLSIMGFPFAEGTEKIQSLEECILSEDILKELEPLNLEEEEEKDDRKRVADQKNKHENEQMNKIMANEQKMLEHDKKISEQDTKLKEIGKQIEELEEKIDQRKAKVGEHERNMANLMQQLEELREKIYKEDKARKTEELQKMQHLENLLDELKVAAEKDRTLPMHEAALEEQKQLLKEMEKKFIEETVIVSEEQTSQLMNKICSLERRLHQDFDELKTKWHQESSFLPDVDAGNTESKAECGLNKILTIENFSTLAGKKIWNSPAMYSESNQEGFKFCVGVGAFLTGDIFAEVLALPGKNDDNLKWPVTAEFAIELINNGQANVSCNSSLWTWERPTSKGSVRLGYFGRMSYRILLSHSELKYFLQKDSLNFLIARVNTLS